MFNQITNNTHRVLFAQLIALDPMCYPQLTNDALEPELTFAQRLAAHINFVVEEMDSDDTNTLY